MNLLLELTDYLMHLFMYTIHCTHLKMYKFFYLVKIKYDDDIH